MVSTIMAEKIARIYQGGFCLFVFSSGSVGYRRKREIIEYIKSEVEEL